MRVKVGLGVGVKVGVFVVGVRMVDVGVEDGVRVGVLVAGVGLMKVEVRVGLLVAVLVGVGVEVTWARRDEAPKRTRTPNKRTQWILFRMAAPKIDLGGRVHRPDRLLPR